MGLPYRRYIDDQVWVSSEAMGAEDEAQYKRTDIQGSRWIRGMPNDASTGVSAILLVLFLRALSIVGIRILIASAFEKSINTRKVNDVDLIQSSKCCVTWQTSLLSCAEQTRDKNDRRVWQNSALINEWSCFGLVLTFKSS